jgi:DNA sulfur modification protein DndD
VRLNRLVLRDFGLYRGHQEMDLAPRQKYGRTRPIILFGGHNGAGKTTILEALRLCLYGRLALGERTKEQEYHQYLRDRVHRDRQALIPATSASVMVEFEYARSGKRSVYTVERSWDVSKSKVTEDLTVLCNGEPLADIESQFWSDFLRSLVPPGLSQLFFFDGEKIQKLAQDDEDSATLADSVKALLGLDFVERLRADLDLFVARETKGNASGSDAVRLSTLEAQISEQEAAVAKAKQGEASQRDQLEYTQKEVARLEQLLAVEGHGLAGQRQELRQRRSETKGQYDSTAKTLRELCEGPLPFAVCPKLANELLLQLDKEARFERWEASRDEVGDAVKEILKHLTKGAAARSLRWEATTRNAVAREVAAVGARLTSVPAPLEGFVPLHGLSVRDREDAKKHLSAAIAEAAPAAAKLSKQLASLDEEQRSIQAKLNKAPDDDEVGPRVQELSALHKKETELQVLFSQKEATRVELDVQLSKVKRDRDRLQEKVREGGATSQVLSTALRTKEALGEYLEKLTTLKVKQLEEATMDCFSRLARKRDLVKSIHIDPQTFRVELADKTGRRLPKSELSAGEKQIYAISVLWALARVSGRPLPMIIDTPLARLDSIHREKLIQNYFPNASHQVIILSTDTEIDVQYYEALKPHLSHAIRLLSHEEGWSEARPGYFWKTQDKEDGRAAASA